MINPELEKRAITYARLSRIQLDFQSPLGVGTDGCVWQSLRKTAIKVFERNSSYTLERECYQRFAAANVSSILGFNIPQLVSYNDRLMAVEMTIVRVPYLLDFGKVQLDAPPDYTEEIWNDWRESNKEIWEARWPRVLSLLSAIKRYGIYYVDPNPGNITFAE